MEHSIVVLVALVLLIVFAGFQFQKVWDLFRTQKETDAPVAVKTVVKAEDVVAPKSKTKKSATTSTKKGSNKKPVITKKVKTSTKKKTKKKK